LKVLDPNGTELDYKNYHASSLRFTARIEWKTDSAVPEGLEPASPIQPVAVRFLASPGQNRLSEIYPFGSLIE